MSIEAAIAENTQVMRDLIAALKVTGENQERLIAGQNAAIEKVQPEKRTRAKKDETPAPTPTPEPTPETTTQTAATSVSSHKFPDGAPFVSDDALRGVAGNFLNGKGPSGNTDEKLTAEQVTERRNLIAAVMKELGTPKMCGPESTLDNDGRKRAAFYIRRAHAGLKVDFGADYDFDGDPTQGGGDAADEDDLGI